MRARTAWGLDLGSSALKLVKVQESGGSLHATTYGPVPLHLTGPQADLRQELSHALDRLFQMAGTRPSALHCCLPRHLATVKFPELPKAGRDQLLRMARLDAQRYIPFPLEEVVLGVIDLSSLKPEREEEAEPRNGSASKGEAAMAEVLLIAVREEIVKRYRGALASSLHHRAPLAISSLGAWQLFRYAASRKEVSPEGCYLLLDVGGSSTTVSVLRNGVLDFSRSVGVGGDVLTAAFASTYGLEMAEAERMKTTRGLGVLDMPAPEPPWAPEGEAREAAWSGAADDAPEASARSLVQELAEPQLAEPPEGEEAVSLALGTPAAVEDWYGRLIMEVRRSIAAFSAERRHLEVEGIYLLGGSANLPGLMERLRAELELPVAPMPSGGVCRDPQFAEATGQAMLGLDPSMETIDLVPEEEIRHRAQARRRLRMRLATVVATAALAVAAVWGAGAIRENAEMRVRLQSEQRRTATFTAEARRLQQQRDRLRQQLNDLQKALSPQHNWLDVLQEISLKAPPDVWLVKVSLEKGKPMVIGGIAKTNTSPAAMATALGQSDIFTNVNLGYTNETKIGNETVVNFSITGEIQGNEPKLKKTLRSQTRRTPTP